MSTITITETSQVKRLLSEHLVALDGKEENSSKRQCVRFDDNVEVLSSIKSCEYNPMRNEEHEEQDDDDVDFFLSIADDGDWDYTITTTTKPSIAYDALPCEELKFSKISRPTSPFAGCDRQLCEELYRVSSSSTYNKSKEDAEAEEQGLLFRVGSNNSLGNNLTISLKACNYDTRPIVMPTPLITPPSSPRRVRTMSFDGTTEVEATICAW
eukprot:867638_1